MKRNTKPLKRTPLYAKTGFKKATIGPMKPKNPLRRTPLRKVGISPISKLQQRLWALCREITRKRYGNTCYTCSRGNLSGSDWQTGHFIAKSVCSTELKYSLDNLRIQCSACNIWKSGNWLEFEAHLRRDSGDEWVKNLKKRNQETKGLKYDRIWYEDFIKLYTEILNEN